jgi:hypothetical protein
MWTAPHPPGERPLANIAISPKTPETYNQDSFAPTSPLC